MSAIVPIAHKKNPSVMRYNPVKPMNLKGVKLPVTSQWAPKNIRHNMPTTKGTNPAMKKNLNGAKSL